MLERRVVRKTNIMFPDMATVLVVALLSSFLNSGAVTADIMLRGNENRKLDDGSLYPSFFDYYPANQIIDQAAMDMDLKEIEHELNRFNADGFSNAKKLYKKGAHSASYAKLHLVSPITADIQPGTIITGKTAKGDDVTGTVEDTFDGKKGTNEIWFLYDVEGELGEHVNCQVGGSSKPILDGCLSASGVVTIGDAIEALYIYEPEVDNRSLRSFRSFSLAAKKNMYDCKNYCPYPDFSKFYQYYGNFDYANQWVFAALDGNKTVYNNGNQDFNLVNSEGKAAAVTIGTAFINLWMYTIRSMETAVDKCDRVCNPDSNHSSDKSCGDHDTIHHWDEAVAYYTGSLEHTEEYGYLMYSLANEMCATFHTCGSESDNDDGNSYVNYKVYDYFNKGQQQLTSGQCHRAREGKKRVVNLMTIPLIQATLRSAHIKDQLVEKQNDFGATDRRLDLVKGQLAGFAASILPIVHSCSEADAKIIYDKVRLNDESEGRGTYIFKEIKTALENNYECMGIVCEEVGGVLDLEYGTYFVGAAPCNTRSDDFILEGSEETEEIVIVRKKEEKPDVEKTSEEKQDVEETNEEKKKTAEEKLKELLYKIEDERIASNHNTDPPVPTYIMPSSNSSNPLPFFVFDPSPHESNNHSLSLEHTYNNNHLHYKPMQSISDRAAVDMDQREIEIEVSKMNDSGFTAARHVYMRGAHSASYAQLSLTHPLTTDIESGTHIIGYTVNGDRIIGTAQKSFRNGTKEVWFLYQVRDTFGEHVDCQVGGSSKPILDGCLREFGAIKFGDSPAVMYTYDPSTNNKNLRSFSAMSLGADESMYKCDKYCPYPDYFKFFKYYNKFDYANDWVLVALSGEGTTYKNGNQDFRLLSMEGRAEAVSIGAAFINLWMYTIRSMEKALDKCDSRCNSEAGSIESCDGNKTIHQWDEAVAYYTGALEQGDKKGYLMYALANEMCTHFHTCGANGDDYTGTSFVNTKVYGHFREGQQYLLQGKCEKARSIKERIVQYMTVPLVQATLHNANRRDHYMEEKITFGVKKAELEPIKGRLISFAASVLPIVHNCSEVDAGTIYNAIRLYDDDNEHESTSTFNTIKVALENNYECMGIRCEDVGGFIDEKTGIYYDGTDPCGSNEVKLSESVNDNDNRDNNYNGKVKKEKETQKEEQKKEKEIIQSSLSFGLSLPYLSMLHYQPVNEITDFLAMDLDQREIGHEVDKFSASGFAVAKNVYTYGAHSASFAQLSLETPLTLDVKENTEMFGHTTKGDRIVGKVEDFVEKGDNEIWFLYDIYDKSGEHRHCQVGGSGSPNMGGCLNASGTVKIGGLDLVSYTYDPEEDNNNLRSFYSFSQEAKESMYTCQTYCPYSDYLKFYKYYDKFDYANEWVFAAFGGHEIRHKNGNQDLSLLNRVGRAEAIKIGTSFINLWMYIIRSMEKALDKCDRLCNNNDESCGENKTVHRWDEAVAYYAGTLQQGEESDIMMYSLADEMCSHFGTCGTGDKDDDGTSFVNFHVYGNFREGQHHLSNGQCESARKNKENIVRLMTIPLIQATLRNAHRRDHYVQEEVESGTTKEKLEVVKGRLVSFAASVLPIVHDCSEVDARTLYNNVQLYNGNSSSFSEIKSAFENNYECMGIKCEEIGGFINSNIGDYYDDANPCTFEISSKKGGILDKDLPNYKLPHVDLSSWEEGQLKASLDEGSLQGNLQRMLVAALVAVAIMLALGIFIYLFYRNWTAAENLGSDNRKHLDDSFAGSEADAPLPNLEKFHSLQNKKETSVTPSRLVV